MIQCRSKARASLIEDGLDKDEALAAVEPSSTDLKKMDVGSQTSESEDETQNPFKLKRFSIRLKRVRYIEQAVKKGYPSVLMSRNPKLRPKRS